MGLLTGLEHRHQNPQLPVLPCSTLTRPHHHYTELLSSEQPPHPFLLPPAASINTFFLANQAPSHWDHAAPVLPPGTRFYFVEGRQHLCQDSKGVAGVPVTAFSSVVASSGMKFCTGEFKLSLKTPAYPSLCRAQCLYILSLSRSSNEGWSVFRGCSQS